MHYFAKEHWYVYNKVGMQFIKYLVFCIIKKKLPNSFDYRNEHVECNEQFMKI